MKPLLLLLLPLSTLPSPNNFCGTSWSEASSSCANRQHCPTGSDDECTLIPDSICYADTLCDASKGDGANAAKLVLEASVGYLVEVDYGDAMNKRFCGSWWADADENCGMDSFCGRDEECGDNMSCYETQCNIQDLVAEKMGDDWKDKLSGGKDANGKYVKLDESDARRNNFCGSTWADANSRCGTWCLGEDTDCPGSLKCFAETGCYYDEDLKPSLSPTTGMPTTAAPVKLLPYDDLANQQFCGSTWPMAVANCSPETHCIEDDDCPKGETCVGFLPGCHLGDMLKESQEEEIEVKEEEDAADEISQEESFMTKDDPTNNYFCGTQWDEAVENCSLETHCPDDVCPQGSSCFHYIEQDGCDAYEFWLLATDVPSSTPSVLTDIPSSTPSADPTMGPTVRPTGAPTVAPAPIVYGLCAKSPEHLLETFREATQCSSINHCPDGLSCIDGIDFQAVSKNMPSMSPAKKLSEQPTDEPSLSPSRTEIHNSFTLSPVVTEAQMMDTISPSFVTSDESSAAALDHSGTLMPTFSINADTEMPTFSTNTDIPTHVESANPVQEQELTFYCAFSVEELENSCNTAIKCTTGPSVCPEGQGCIYYECEEHSNNEQDISSFVPECPIDFVGIQSTSVFDCKLYWECRDGEIGELQSCDDGLKYDLIRDMCWYEHEVDSDCRGSAMGTTEPTSRPTITDLPSFQPTPSPTYDTSNLICPENFVGATSNSDSNCKLYWDCRDGVVGAIAICRDELRYDIVRQMCWYENEVDEFCYGPPLDEPNSEDNSQQEPNEANNNQDFTVAGNEITNSEIVYECPSGYTGWVSHNGCKQYYWCKNGGMDRDILYCVESLLFDVKHGICKHASEVNCNESTTTEPAAGKEYLWPEAKEIDDVKTSEHNIGDWYERTDIPLLNPAVCLKSLAVTVLIPTLIINWFIIL